MMMDEIAGTEEYGEETASTAYTADNYHQAALLLARTYPAIKAERENIRKWQSGERKYTEDDALEELISITPKSDDSLGVRVQTSGTSDQTAQIGLLLASGYVEKKQQEIMQEMFSPEMMDHISYLDWKIGIVETAGRERMNKTQRLIFSNVFIKARPYGAIQRRLAGKGIKMSRAKISRAKKQVVKVIADELKIAAQVPGNQPLIDLFIQEVESHERHAKENG